VTRSIAITGGAGGIGRATALAAGQRGWSVAVLDRDEAGAQRVAAEAQKAGARSALGILCDVGDEPSVEAAIATADRELEGIDGAFANAGIEVQGVPHRTTIDEWDFVLRVNLTGVFLTVKHVAGILIGAGRPGAIVCTSSPSAFVGFAGGANSAYGASKGGVSAFVRAAALDYARAGIRVNAVVPGATETAMLLGGLGAADQSRRRAEVDALAREQIPLGRVAQPAEIAEGAIWLLDDASSYVTGANLVIDGGLLARGSNTF
jgi:NAD(P)-dependent dehydrogenase (short-subunit alcohol dehydrogenase family)